jgi:hypothetical protein
MEGGGRGPGHSGWNPPLKDWWMSELVGQKIRSSSGIGSEPHHTSQRHIGAAAQQCCSCCCRCVRRDKLRQVDKLKQARRARKDGSASRGCQGPRVWS